MSLHPHMKCKTCGRTLDHLGDPLSLDCGGDCWGCVGEIEAELGFEPSLAKVRVEAANGLRPGWIEPLDDISRGNDIFRLI
jgi:hypothetical protein